MSQLCSLQTPPEATIFVILGSKHNKLLNLNLVFFSYYKLLALKVLEYKSQDMNLMYTFTSSCIKHTHKYTQYIISPKEGGFPLFL